MGKAMIARTSNFTKDGWLAGGGGTIGDSYGFWFMPGILLARNWAATAVECPDDHPTLNLTGYVGYGAKLTSAIGIM
jgi:hypothetical protein